jgi:hypothetical protein
MKTNVSLQLYFCDGTEPVAVEGMGWYINAHYIDDGKFVQVIPRVRIPAAEAEKFAKVADNFVNGKPMNWLPEQGNSVRSDEGLASVVEAANVEAKALAAQQLAQAEEAVKRVEYLRTRASEWQ